MEHEGGTETSHGGVEDKENDEAEKVAVEEVNTVINAENEVYGVGSAECTLTQPSLGGEINAILGSLNDVQVDPFISDELLGSISEDVLKGKVVSDAEISFTQLERERQDDEATAEENYADNERDGNAEIDEELGEEDETVLVDCEWLSDVDDDELQDARRNLKKFLSKKKHTETN